MNILNWFSKKPKPEIHTVEECVKIALEVTVYGLVPPLTDSEFEDLYVKILDAHIHDRPVDDILNNALSNRAQVSA